MLLDGFLAPGTLIRYLGPSQCVGDATYLTIISGLGGPPTNNLRA
jgi:hypothetical protein